MTARAQAAFTQELEEGRHRPSISPLKSCDGRTLDFQVREKGGVRYVNRRGGALEEHLARGRIDDRQYEAGRWARGLIERSTGMGVSMDYRACQALAGDPDGISARSRGSGNAQADILTDLTWAQKEVGKPLWRILREWLGGESFSDLGIAIGCRRETVSDMVRLALDALAKSLEQRR